MNGVNETKRVQQLYDRVAEQYDSAIGLVERWFLSDRRRNLCAEANGAVLELAVGTGCNIPLYSADVQLTGIDLSSKMIRVAQRRAAPLGSRTALCVADAQLLPFPDTCFDMVVATLALCSIPAERRALTEARRVLRPGGQLLLLEHVRSPNRLVRAMQRLAAPIFCRLAADHILRDPLDYLDACGFVVERSERFAWGVGEQLRARKR